MKKKMIGISAFAMVAVAVMLIATSNVGTPDLFAKRYGHSNAQSAAVSNECPAFQDNDNEGNQAGVNQLAALTTNCIGVNNLIQDSDGAAISSSPSTAGSSDQGGLGPVK